MNIIGKRTACLFAVLTVFFLVSIAFAERAAVPVNVIVNKGTIVTLKEPSSRVSLSNPDIAELNLISPKEILLNGKKVGTTTLIVWDQQGKVTFFDVAVMGDLAQLEQYIKETAPHDDIKVDLAGDTIILYGTAANQQTIDKVVQLAQAYAVASEVTSTTKYVEGRTETETKSTGKLMNHIRIEEAQQIVLEVKVAQIDKSKLKELGISTLIKGHSAEGFTNMVGAPVGAVDTDNFIIPGVKTHAEGIAGNIPGLSAITPLDPFQIGVSHFPSGIGAVLKALTTQNLAKVLAEPNMVVRSGGRGDFHVGQRFPVQIVTGTGSNATVGITYEEIGIRLNFAPEVLETGAIRLKIDPAEVSNIQDFVRNATTIAPIIDTRTVRTSVDLREGESLILAGLLTEETKKNIQKVPFLGDIPILGAFFRTTSDDLRNLELAFFITPRLVKPMPKGARPELPGEKPLTPEEMRQFDWIPLGMNK